MDWLIAHAFWVLGAAAVFVGFLFSVHAMLQSIRRHASLLAMALLTASIILWPARLWVTHHPQLAAPQTTIEAIITVALWLLIAAVPLAIIGRPRLAPFVVIAAVITFVFWARTAPQTSLWTMLRVRNPIPFPAQQPSIKPSPAVANSAQQPNPTASRANSR